MSVVTGISGANQTKGKVMFWKRKKNKIKKCRHDWVYELDPYNRYRHGPTDPHFRGGNRVCTKCASMQIFRIRGQYLGDLNIQGGDLFWEDSAIGGERWNIFIQSIDIVDADKENRRLARAEAVRQAWKDLDGQFDAR